MAQDRFPLPIPHLSSTFGFGHQGFDPYMDFDQQGFDHQEFEPHVGFRQRFFLPESSGTNDFRWLQFPDLKQTHQARKKQAQHLEIPKISAESEFPQIQTRLPDGHGPLNPRRLQRPIRFKKDDNCHHTINELIYDGVLSEDEFSLLKQMILYVYPGVDKWNPEQSLVDVVLRIINRINIKRRPYSSQRDAVTFIMKSDQTKTKRDVYNLLFSKAVRNSSTDDLSDIDLLERVFRALTTAMSFHF